MRRAAGLRHLVPMSTLELRQVSKVYGQGAAEVHALREVDLEVDPGTRLRRQSIGYVFHDFNLLPGLTAAENVALPLELDGVGQDR